MLFLFFLVWVIFNGAITAEIVGLGVIIALFMFAFACKFMDYSLKKEWVLLMRSGYFLLYVVELVVEIVRANAAVCHLILSRNEVVEPVMVSFRTTLKSPVFRTLLANSITLTPGTITVSMNGDELVVHCLDKSFSEGMDSSVFVTMLEKMERIGAAEGRKGR